MRTLLLLALTVMPALALRRVNAGKPKDKRFVRKHCEMKPNFVRKVNPNAHRVPTEEETARPNFYDEPHLEKIFYINLDKGTDRRESIEKELEKGFPGVKVERWRATQKNELRILKQNFSDFSEVGYGDYAPPGAQATYLSHSLLLKHIAKQPDENAVYIIVEDDVHMGRQDLMQDVECQLKMLPPEWDLFKFGYWGFRMPHGPPKSQKTYYPDCPGEAMNDFTCHQEHFHWGYMGNQAYAVRPQGAAVLVEHLKSVPVMDVDGAMMPGNMFEKKTKRKALWPNTYVSKFNLVGHYGFYSMRGFKASVSEEALEDVDGNTEERVAQETKKLADDENGRETSVEEFKRILNGESDLIELED